VAATLPADTVPLLPVGRGRRSELLANLRRAARSGRGAFGLVVFVVVVAFAVFGPMFAPHVPTDSLTVPLSKPGGAYPLGTDQLGRDVLSRLLAGGRVLLVMAVCATALGVVVGSVAGVTAAYLRGWADGVIMRSVDVVLAFPQLVFALLLVSVAGPKLWLIVLAVGFTHAPAVARVIRSAALDVTERDFVKAVEINGVSSARIMLGEILPNLVTPLMVEIGLRLTYSIGLMAGLGFLGFGQPPPAPNWGLMISENLIGISSNPWAIIAPAVAIALLTIGTNTFTDAFSRVAIGADRPVETAALATALVEEGGL
jgi:peptide/nickel transport system permease protein